MSTHSLLPRHPLQSMSACSPSALHFFARFAMAAGLTVAAYCTDQIFAEETNADTDRLIPYGEPTPQGVGPLDKHLNARSVHKLILMSTEERIQQLRPHANDTIGRLAALTQALPGMLEVSTTAV